jgi:hypothetical protein
MAIPLTLGAGALSWGHAGTHDKAKPAPPSADELAAFAAAKPAFSRHCFKCHTRAGKKARPKALKHLDMTTYPFGGHHAADVATAVRRSVAGEDGKAPTMPSDDPGAVQGDDLAKILAWAAAFDRAHPGR